MRGAMDALDYLKCSQQLSCILVLSNLIKTCFDSSSGTAISFQKRNPELCSCLVSWSAVNVPTMNLLLVCWTNPSSRRFDGECARNCSTYVIASGVYYLTLDTSVASWVSQNQFFKFNFFLFSPLLLARIRPFFSLAIHIVPVRPRRSILQITYYATLSTLSFICVHSTVIVYRCSIGQLHGIHTWFHLSQRNLGTRPDFTFPILAFLLPKSSWFSSTFATPSIPIAITLIRFLHQPLAENMMENQDCTRATRANTCKETNKNPR